MMSGMEFRHELVYDATPDEVFEMLADPIGFAALLSDQCSRRLIVAEIFVAKDRSWHQPVTAKILESLKTTFGAALRS